MIIIIFFFLVRIGDICIKMIRFLSTDLCDYTEKYISIILTFVENNRKDIFDILYGICAF